jgi:TonB family protein
MTHGIHGFFEERRFARRRVSLLSTGVGVVMLAAIMALQIPVIRRNAERAIPILRFGVAGPERIVPLVRLQSTITLGEPLREIGQVVARREGGGRGSGKPQPAKTATREAEPTGPRLRGLGDDAHDLVARALASQGRVPIFQSEELVITHLVKPEYPEEMRARGIEGRVSVLALIDTLGKVIDAEVMRASGQLELDRAAEVAVRKCLFLPYKEDGAAREVYAVFPFIFRIY